MFNSHPHSLRLRPPATASGWGWGSLPQIYAVCTLDAVQSRGRRLGPEPRASPRLSSLSRRGRPAISKKHNEILTLQTGGQFVGIIGQPLASDGEIHALPDNRIQLTRQNI